MADKLQMGEIETASPTPMIASVPEFSASSLGPGLTKPGAERTSAEVSLSQVKPSEVAVSPDGLTLYTSSSDGVLRVYDVRTGGLIHAWSVGTDLGGVDISPDGSFIMVVERDVVARVYKVDTTTGDKTTFNLTPTNYDPFYGPSSFFDVATLSNGTALLSRNFNGSGWVDLQILNLDTGQFTSGQSVRQSSSLTRSATGSTVLIAEANTSNGALDIYETGLGIVHTGGANGFNWGIQAYDASFGLVAQYIYNEGIVIYNASLQQQAVLPSWTGGRVAGLAFDSFDLFVLDRETDAIVQIRKSDWTIVKSMPVGADIGEWSGEFGLGNQLIVDPQDRYFSVVTDTGLHLVDYPRGVTYGTEVGGQLHGSLFADDLRGFSGDDVISGYGGDDILNGGEGNDTLNGGAGSDTASYQFSDSGVNVSLLISGPQDTGQGVDLLVDIENVYGTTFPDVLIGNDAANILSAGSGLDQLFGGGGNDVLFMGAALSDYDTLDGGDGLDTIVMQGFYSSELTLGTGTAGQITNVEYISLQSGSITRWGQAGLNLYTYNLTLLDPVVVAGQQMRINGQSLLAGEDFTFNGSAESDGKFLVYGGFGVDILTGGAGNDIFFFEAGRFGSTDKVNGGGGADALVISGGSSASPGLLTLNIAAGTMTSIESLSFNGRFASDPSATPSYNVTLQNGNIAAGAILIVNGSSLGSSQSLSFNGSAETNGKFTLYGGAGADTLRGGANADLIYAAGGADQLAGGAAADTFQYRSTQDSTASATDNISDFQSGSDKIDLQQIDAISGTAGDDAFHFIGSSAFSGTAGELRVMSTGFGSGWTLQADTNGDGIADLQVVGSGAIAVGDLLL